uniref:Acetaldehyde dehydrogenase n=1 Tax=Pseudomonas fluorescens TaxID=294 RepID=Q83V30_PSEFL|nr:acetaldehyde dehydrogenase [Pseudomonas fluorescens]
MDQNTRLNVAIIGSGNIGTDLMIKVLRNSKHLAMGAMVGIDAASDGLARAARMGVATTHEGITGLVNLPGFEQIRIVFDATSAGAHAKHNEILQQHGVKVIDLTPAAIGPYVIPVVNLADHLASPNINMVTCGGQATIPVVRAVSRVTRVRYAEIVASIASKSAGPGTRANIDEFTETTSQAIVSVGGAEHGKAIIVLNPAEPPLMMRDTVLCLAEADADTDAIRQSIEQMVKEVAAYVPGYRMKQDVQFDTIPADQPINIPGVGLVSGIKVSVFLEVEGAAHYLPAYAGNLDIMTSAALAAADQIVAKMIGAGQGDNHE